MSGAWMFVCCECCVFSGRGLCDGLITRPEESYRLWHVVVFDKETSKTRRLKARYRAMKIQSQWVVTPGNKQTNNILCDIFRYAPTCISLVFVYGKVHLVAVSVTVMPQVVLILLTFTQYILLVWS
jgi:hypothetical protein